MKFVGSCMIALPRWFMPCDCIRWYKSSINDFDRVTDREQLGLLIESVAIESKFERGMLILEYPTPFSKHECVILSRGAKPWVGSVHDEVFATLYSCFAQSTETSTIKPWRLMSVPAVLGSYLGAESQRPLSGVVHRTISNAGVLYYVLFIRQSTRVTASEVNSLSMKMICVSELAKRVGARLGLERFKSVTFTVRERDILRWTADGKSAGDIAGILEISENTVNYHIKKILAKTGSFSKFHAAAQAASYRVF